MEEVKKQSNNVKGSTIAGILLVIIGGLLLVDNFGFYHIFWRELFNWQIILIVVGMFMLCDKDTKTVGYVLISIGAFFLLCKYIDFSDTLKKLFWPAVFILTGFALIVGKRNHKGKGNEAADNSSSFIEDFALLSGNNQKSTSQNLKGGRITTFFGGSQVNLMESTMAQGSNKIRVRCFCGRTRIYAPANWRIKIEAISIFGAIKDKRASCSSTSEAEPELIITGFVFFGNCSIL